MILLIRLMKTNIKINNNYCETYLETNNVRKKVLFYVKFHIIVKNINKK